MSPLKPSSPGLLCAMNFPITASITLAVIGLFRFFASSFSFGDYIFLEMCPFHLGFQISWHTVAHINFLESFVFLWYQL